MLASEKDKLLNLEEILAKRVVGQKEAIVAVADAIRRNKSGLADISRPMGTFLFLGPTGVGKTELAKTLADFLFSDEKAITRIDMSEYMEKHTVSRLIGAPPGYVGYEEGGQLTEAVRRRPYSVVLFDEVEKAHPDVFNVLLQLLDEGRLTDGQGRVVDFRNCLIIMTSNIGGDLIQNAAKMDDVKEAISALLKVTFKPEFLNRIDETIFFNRLGKPEILKIVDIQLELLKKRLVEKKISLDATPKARAFLAETGYDPLYGARPLKRTIQNLVQNPLAKMVLAGDLPDGGRGDHRPAAPTGSCSGRSRAARAVTARGAGAVRRPAVERRRIHHVDRAAAGKGFDLVENVGKLDLVLIPSDIADVWGADDILQFQQRVIRVQERFGLVNIHRRQARAAGTKRAFQRIRLDQSGAAGVHQERRGFHSRKICRGDDATGFGNQAHVERKDIAALEECSPVGCGFAAVCACPRKRCLTRPYQHIHAKRLAISGDDAPDAAIAADPEGFAPKCRADADLPPSPFQRGDLLGDLSHPGKHQPPRQLRSGIRR